MHFAQKLVINHYAYYSSISQSFKSCNACVALKRRSIMVQVCVCVRATAMYYVKYVCSSLDFIILFETHQSRWIVSDLVKYNESGVGTRRKAGTKMPCQIV